jgi:hypothetical protein
MCLCKCDGNFNWALQGQIGILWPHDSMLHLGYHNPSIGIWYIYQAQKLLLTFLQCFSGVEMLNQTVVTIHGGARVSN